MQLITNIRQARERQRRHRDLVKQLSEYRTPAERAELDAIIERYPAHQTVEIRRAADQLR